MNYSNSTTGNSLTYSSPYAVGYASTDCNMYVYVNGGWQRLYRSPATCSFETRKQEEITKEDIDALL